MSKDGQFADFDEEEVYQNAKAFTLDLSTQNFIVEFGQDKAQIAFNVEKNGFEKLLKSQRTAEYPIRWINIWKPQLQPQIVEAISKHYHFSARLEAIIRSNPGVTPPQVLPSPKAHRFRPRLHHDKDDVEHRASSIGERPPPTVQNRSSHYSIVRDMYHYHALDVSKRFLCIGANWMHGRMTYKQVLSDTFKEDEEEKRCRLYSWLVLCDDNTVISFHEDPGNLKESKDIELIRSNLLSVLKQISKLGFLNPAETDNPLEIQAVRQAFNDESGRVRDEGASNLFYYLFDDWYAAYSTVKQFREELKDLRRQIFDNIHRKSVESMDNEIIPSLHVLGANIRQMHHVYEGYKNLIQRILEPQKHLHATALLGESPKSTASAAQSPPLALSAVSRFQRLGDRLQLLILNETKEFVVEKDALINTYFNINAQKDSEATARLTRAATLLAKLSVLFLPVNLMTAYFSTQIKGIQDIYTMKDYWYSFAVIMCISFLFLFFFGKLLMLITETLDNSVKKTGKYFKRLMIKKKEKEKVIEKEKEK
ncbi:hypothetical protein BGZ60DRAFT_412784 [Tricladium varicosporioides]|nr:hypothetical protein BGZ60DRAFT_412784 [Hymenoscyphus varicosporioides]